MQESATRVTFAYLNRGFFNIDKLTIASLLCLRLLVDTGELEDDLVRKLIGPIASASPPDMPSAVSEWLPESLWSKVKALELEKPVFDRLGEAMEVFFWDAAVP